MTSSRDDHWLDGSEDWLGPDPPQKPVKNGAAAPPPTDETPIVRWLPVYCPRCRSIRCRVTGKPKSSVDLRYHRCLDCETVFKSMPIPPG